MDFKFTAADEAFRKEVREFIQQEQPPGWEGYGYLFDFPSEFWEFGQRVSQKSTAKGWGPGGGLSDIQRLILSEEGAYYGIPRMGSVTFAIHIIAHHGTEEQKKKFLPIFYKGDVFSGIGLSEPDAGSDLASLKTTAVRDGDYYIINGQKTWQSEAHHAEWTCLLTRTNPNVPKQKGLSCFLIDMKTPGISIQLVENCYGDKIFGDVFYDNVRVHKDFLVGGEDKGWEVGATLLAAERGGVERIAASRRILDVTVDYAKKTKRNGELLSKNPMIRQKLAQLAIDVEAGRWFCYRLIWMRSQKIRIGNETSVAKLHGGELVQRAGRVAMEVMGMHGQLMKESKGVQLNGKMPYWSLHTLCRTLGGGSSEMQRNIIARTLGLPQGKAR